MPLLNYTTSVPADRTIGQIHKLLVSAGAEQILTTYSGSEDATGLAFAITSGTWPRRYTLPINAQQVWNTLNADPEVPGRYRLMAHAERVAWRIVKDWLEAQLAIIETGMVALDQVMLPYMQGDDGRTVYELYVDQQLALPRGD